jgi:hypothetical protein
MRPPTRPAALLFVALAVAGCGRTSPGGLSPREAFEREVRGCSPREVRQTLGGPDAVLPGLAPGVISGAEADDRVQSAALGGGDPGYETWVYKGRTLDPKAGRPDAFVRVHFERGRVARFGYPDDPRVFLPPAPPPRLP